MTRTFALAAAALLAAGLTAQNWTLTVPATTPGIPAPRSWSTLTMDPVRGSSLLFGGYDGTTATSLGSLGDTWRYHAGTNTWTALAPATSPAARDSHVMAFDLGRGVGVLFGGWDSNFNTFGDTFEWNGSQWSVRTPVGRTPPARGNAAMVYDHARGTCLLFGGTDQTLNLTYNDTWEWNGTAWTQLAPVVSPPARSGHAMAYDVGRDRVVMFGGVNANWGVQSDTWEFDGATWTQVVTPVPPPGRVFSAMTFDIGRGCCLMVGGMDHLYQQLGDTWEYGTSWSLRTTLASPSARDSMALTYDTVQNCAVLFGGYDPVGNDHRDTWEFTAANAATYVTFGAGCAGSSGVPALQAQNAPAIGSTFRLQVRNLPSGGGVVVLVLGFRNTIWNGQPLPLSLTPFGLTGCTAFCDVSASTVLVHGNGVALWNLSVPNQPSLNGTRFFNQAVSLDPLAGNPAGAVVSNAGDGLVH